MTEVRALSGVYICIPCRDKAGNGININISWHDNFYGCEHVVYEDLKKNGYHR